MPDNNTSSNVTPLPGSDVDFDMDAFLEQRAEATGRAADQGSFRHKGEEWSFTHPAYASDEWSKQLEELEEDEDANVRDLAQHYLGEEQFDRYLKAGGTAMTAVTSVGRSVAAEQKQGMTGGRPTRSSRSSGKRRRK